MNERKLTRYFFSALTTLLLFTSVPGVAYAAGELMVTPTRIVFELRTRTAQVTLVNQGSDTSNFRISFVRQNMTEAGDFVEVAESEAGLYSDPMIRFSPRQVSLPPGQSQVIRLQLRKPSDLVDGEYRSHMLFQALPPSSSNSVNIAATDSTEGITIELIPIVGVSIPVIVRHGNLSSNATLSDPGIIPADDANSSPKIAVDINRKGNSSIYGDLRVSFTANGEEPVVVAQANGLAVYANIDRRRFTMPISIPEGVNLSNGVLDIILMQSGSKAESGTMAKSRLVLK
jgi:hypothetical protein